MMVAFARELLCEVVQEVQPLLELHYDELTLNKDVIRLDPIWDEYKLMERLQRFVIFTARDEGKLVGYNAFNIFRHPHYGGFTIAQNDVLFLHPECRRGATGLRLIDFAEEQCSALAADKIVYHIKFSFDWRPILHRRGYVDEEVMCAKLLRRP